MSIFTSNSQVMTPQLAEEAAHQLYARARRQGLFHRIVGAIFRRCTALLSLDQAPTTGSYGGAETVPLNAIAGSEGRAADFDDRFYPQQEHSAERWINVARARLMGRALPPVDLVRVGDQYFVRDGHHRISVARAMGERYIDAVVVARTMQSMRL